MKYCSNCGVIEKNSANFCTNCGRNLPKENKILPWYFDTITISFLFAFSFLIVPFIAGVLCLIKHKIIMSKAIKKMSECIDESFGSKEEIINKIYIERHKKIDSLNSEIDSIKKSKDEILNSYRSIAHKVYADKVNEAEKECAEIKEKEQKIMEDQKKAHEEKIAQLQSEINALSKQLTELETEVAYAFSKIEVDDNITSEEYKNQLTMERLEESDLIKSGDAIIYNFIGNQKAQQADVKQILRCFNSECAILISNVTTKNIDAYRSRIMRSYDLINKIFATDGISLSRDILNCKLNQLITKYQYECRKEEERLQQKEIREQMIEEEKARREIETQKRKLEKEEGQFINQIDKLMKYMQKSQDIEKQLYISQIEELQKKLAAVQKDKEDVLHREQNTRAGFVYIISNIGSFGENIYKIGMTRRLEPMDRISELSSASVPFEFDVHAMIFSDDAPALESILHNTFADKRVNLVNSRKEFFHVTLDEIEDVVKKNYNATVTFTKIAEAQQYRESLKLREESIAKV